jgi:hypothetical protein
MQALSVVVAMSVTQFSFRTLRVRAMGSLFRHRGRMFLPLLHQVCLLGMSLHLALLQMIMPFQIQRLFAHQTPCTTSQARFPILIYTHRVLMRRS